MYSGASGRFGSVAILLFNIAQSLGDGGFSRPPSSVRKARITLSSSRPNSAVLLPADEVGGYAALDLRLLAALVIRAEQEAVQIERNQREDFPPTLSASIGERAGVRCRFQIPAAFLHDLRLFLERAVDFAVNPATLRAETKWRAVNPQPSTLNH